MDDRIHIYIDESGDITPVINGGGPLFLIGCVITDNPTLLNKKINDLKEEIKNSAYYFRNKENFDKDGFHASTNHPDIYGRFIALLNTLNFRSYAVFADKTNENYQDTLKRHPEFYSFLLKILLKDRILKRRDEKIHIVLEQGSTKRTIEKTTVATVLDEINKSLIEEGFITKPIDITFSIQGKNEDNGLSVVDYINHIIYTAKVGDSEGKKFPRAEQNLALVEPKIAVVYDLLNKRYFEGRKETSKLFDFLKGV